MSADITITLAGLTAFCIFVAAQPVVFRLIGQDESLRWIVKLYCLAGALLCISVFVLKEHAIGSFMIYTGMVGVYIFCIFSVLEASLTLRILGEIAKGGKKGVTPEALLARYNTTVIVRRRIARFVRSGDFRLLKGVYYLTHALTAYKLRERFVSFFIILFPQL